MATGGEGEFIDLQGRFGFVIPDRWRRDAAASAPGLVAQYRTARPDGAFGVTATTLPDGVAIDAVPQLVEARLRAQYADYRRTGIAPASVAGETGAELSYTATAADGQLLAVAQTLVAHGGTLYLITVAAKPDDIGAARQAAAPILASWRWLA